MSAPGFTPIQLYFSTTAAATPSAGNLANGELAVNITDGKLFYKDNGGVVRVLATAAGAAGDVVGPGSSTDNALVRFDGTTGKLVQSSVGVLSDAGALSGLTSVAATTFTGALTGNASTATTLQTSRTIWGQSFDGSANVTGALTGVTDLTASGSLTLNGGTANGVAYLNGSKVLTTGSALTFDGAELGFTRASSAFYRATESGAGVISYFGSFGGVNYIGTTSNHPVAFYQNGSEQMRLTSTGLGIGTSSPSTKLTVHAGADGDVGFFRGGSTRQVQIGTSSTAGYINTDNGSAGLELRTQGTARAYLDNSGNLGLGVTPSAWRSSARAFQLGNTGYASLNEQANGSTSLNFNCYESAANTWTYYVTGVAPTRYTQLSGVHAWYTAASGTAGNAISFTQAMTLDASGNLGVGNTSPSSYDATARNLVVGTTSGNNGITIVSGATNTGYLLFARGTTGADPYRGFVGYNHTSDFMTLATNGSERARITSGGDLLVGTTTNTNTSKLNVVQTTASGYTTAVEALDNGGTFYLTAFRTANTIRGAITSNGTGVTYGSNSDYRLKEAVEPMQGALARNALLNPVKYKWKIDGSEGEGFIAHELQGPFPGAVTGTKDAVDADGNPIYQGIGTGPLDGHFAACINELTVKLEAALARIESLESK